MNICFSPKGRLMFRLITLISISSTNLLAQEQETEDNISRKANAKFAFGNYTEALPLYMEMLKIDSTNYIYNYRTGVCFFESGGNTSKSIYYFEKALKYKPVTDGATFDFYYDIATAYKSFNNYDKAIEYFRIAKSFHNSIDTIVDRDVKQCEYGIEMMARPTEARIYNLGENINSAYPDYSSVAFSDNAAIIFTSARKGVTGNKTNVANGGYFSDIYASKNTSTAINKPLFSKVLNASKTVNTDASEVALALSGDGRALYFYSGKRLKKAELNIYNLKLKSPTIYKNAAILSTDIAPGMCFVKNDSVLYFVSNRKGGYGGKDIYKTHKQKDGTWSPAENLGTQVNTSYDEESPWMDVSDSTLYFSSEGHRSMGGLDVFKTKYRAGRWIEPINMGYPVNSGADDMFFRYNNKSNTGYYTTMREDGIGNYDIYMVKYLQPLNVLLKVNYEDGLEPKDLKVVILSSKDSVAVDINPKAKVTYQSNCNYKMLIPRYNENNVWDTLYFKTPESVERGKYLQEISFIPVRDKYNAVIGQKTLVYNAFFDIEDAIVKSGVRRNKILLEKFPMCHFVDPAYYYYSNPNLTKEEEYSRFVRTLEPTYENFSSYYQINEVDTAEKNSNK